MKLMPQIRHVVLHRAQRAPSRRDFDPRWPPFTGLHLSRDRRAFVEETARAVVGMLD